MPSRDWDKGDSNWVVSDLLDEARDFLLNFFKSSLAVWWLSRVHLVDSNNKLLDTQGIGQKGMKLWEKSGDQGNMWRTANVSLTQFATGIAVDLTFRGICGFSWQSDMAIDDIKFE